MHNEEWESVFDWVRGRLLRVEERGGGDRLLHQEDKVDKIEIIEVREDNKREEGRGETVLDEDNGVRATATAAAGKVI